MTGAHYGLLTVASGSIIILLSQQFLINPNTAAGIPVGVPRDLSAISAGSYWAEVQWTSDTDAAFKVMYGKTNSRLVQLTNTVYRRSNLSSVGRQEFKALLTNMQPATQYWYRVVAFIHEVSNSSSVSLLKTTETGMSSMECFWNACDLVIIAISRCLHEYCY